MPALAVYRFGFARAHLLHGVTASGWEAVLLAEYPEQGIYDRQGADGLRQVRLTGAQQGKSHGSQGEDSGIQLMKVQA